MLSQAASYAAAALGFVAAASGNTVLVREIASATGAPSAYLAKIIQTLARRGLVSTQRGVGGGVTLSRAAREISLLDICAALDEPVAENRCMLGLRDCSNERPCPAHEFWSAQRAVLMEFLRHTTIADIAAFETRRRWKPPSAGETGGQGGD